MVMEVTSHREDTNAVAERMPTGSLDRNAEATVGEAGEPGR